MSSSVVVLVGRILLVIVFVGSGIAKFADPGTFVGLITSKGLPAPTALNYLAGLLEVLAGLAVIVGFQTRVAAWLLALFSVVAGVIFHTGATGDPMMDALNQAMLLKNFAMAGGLIILATYGPGAISIDARRNVSRI